MARNTIFDVEFRSYGVCVGKLRNEVTNEALTPFQVRRMLPTDEGRFQGGENTAPTPLEYFLTGLVGCLMTQIRVFARRLSVDVADLEVGCNAKWEALRDAVGPYQARPVGFDIDISLISDAPEEKVQELIAASKRACLGWIPVGGRIVSQGTLSLPLHNIEHSIFADPKVAGDPSV
ncbi:OsmC family protein [Alterinioella nitratireducens]|uniref:OsmC family protein n=1 Tax=Alterinioella nitratireducens TaxID=2735915 RepID=UPI0015556F01|nr:OsmC family protein [Alterinioella nitratireducens]NPD21547.1 OsmC family protein [Alterinioella nitratireducens]